MESELFTPVGGIGSTNYSNAANTLNQRRSTADIVYILDNRLLSIDKIAVNIFGVIVDH